MAEYEMHMNEDVFSDRMPRRRQAPTVEWEYQSDLRN
jgi:hypothetical protein